MLAYLYIYLMYIGI